MKHIVKKYMERNTKSIAGDNLYEKERGELFKSFIGNNKKVLDLGCRHGSLTHYFMPDNQVTGVDFDKENLDYFAKTYNCPIIEFDLNEDFDSLGNNSWDAVVLSEVLEHLFYPEEKVSQIAKLLTKDGVFVGSIPNGFSLKNRIRLLFGRPERTTLAEPTHITHFSYRTLYAMLRRHFNSVEIIPIQKQKYLFLAKLSPNFFGFLLAFVCKKPKIK